MGNEIDPGQSKDGCFLGYTDAIIWSLGRRRCQLRFEAGLPSIEPQTGAIAS